METRRKVINLKYCLERVGANSNIIYFYVNEVSAADIMCQFVKVLDGANSESLLAVLHELKKKKEKGSVLGQVYSDRGVRVMIQNETAACALVFMSLESRNDELDRNSGIL